MYDIPRLLDIIQSKVNVLRKFKSRLLETNDRVLKQSYDNEIVILQNYISLTNIEIEKYKIINNSKAVYYEYVLNGILQ